MKRLRQILVLILAVSMVASCLGCNKNESAEEQKQESTLPTVEGKYLVKEGISEYKIVIPEEAGNLINVATQEFNKFFSEATSITLPVVSEKEIETGEKYISIGETLHLQSTDITYELSELGNDGYKIVTKGENIYLIGGSDYGSLYAVYELLSYLVDYDFFYQDCYNLKEGVTEIPLYSFELTDIPDIPTRTASDGIATSDNNNLYRMRVRPYLEDFITINGVWCHNSLQYVKDVEDASTKWFNNDKTQLCYTAHGDEAEYEKMLAATFATLKTELMNDLEKSAVTLTMEDNFDTCTCEACNEMTSKYGAISSTIILYLNDLNQMVKDWFETEEGKPYARDLKILFFAYLGYEAAPATYNEETGKYEANNGISLDDGVYCYLCPINMDYYKGLSDKANEEYYNNLQAWTDITDGKLYLWYYSTNYYYYLAPYDNFNSMQENYRFAVEKGAKYLFDLRQHDESGFVTGWSNLKSYLNYKLAWNADADVSALTDKFFEGYFGPAAAAMREYYDQLRVLTNYNIDNNELGGRRSLYAELVLEQYWPKDILQQWLACCDRAEEEIADLKEKNPSLYNMYHEHINGEKLSVLYLYIQCYSYNTSEDVIDAYKTEFKRIADTLNVSKVSEGQNISSLYESWGIQ